MGKRNVRLNIFVFLLIVFVSVLLQGCKAAPPELKEFLIGRSFNEQTKSNTAPKQENISVPAPQSVPPTPTTSLIYDGMVFVKGGCFEMGNSSGDGMDDEKPLHTVCVNDFFIGRHEVTQKEWMDLIGKNPSYFEGCDQCPVDQVSWDDVQRFISKLQKKEGHAFRLPTEAEWEYAARGGRRKNRWSGTNEQLKVRYYAWTTDNSGSGNSFIQYAFKTQPVESLKPNDLGLYDMNGNVEEWVHDWYGEHFYSESGRDNPSGPSSGKFKILRGGSFSDKTEFISVSKRKSQFQDYRYKYYGFRLAVSSKR